MASSKPKVISKLDNVRSGLHAYLNNFTTGSENKLSTSDL